MKLPKPNLSTERFNIRQMERFEEAMSLGLAGNTSGYSLMADIINAAAQRALSRGAMLWLPSNIPALPSGFHRWQYRVNQQIVLPAGLDVWVDGHAVIADMRAEENAGTAVKWGDSSVSTSELVSKRTIRISVIKQPGPLQANGSWQDKTRMGLEMWNLKDSWISPSAEYFTTGIGYCASTSFGYNYILERRINSNRYGTRAICGKTGWFNQNIMEGGHYAVESQIRQQLGYPDTDMGLNPWGNVLESEKHPCNNNIWIQPNYELNGTDNTPPGSGIDHWKRSACVVFESQFAVDNLWINARHENNSVDGLCFFLIRAPGVDGNVAYVGYTHDFANEHPTVETDSTYEGVQLQRARGMIQYDTYDSRQGTSNRVINIHQQLNERAVESQWSTGPMGAVAKQCNSAGSIMVPGLYWVNQSVQRQAYSFHTGHTVPSNERHMVLQFGSTSGTREGLAVLIDTRFTKKIRFKMRSRPYPGAGPSSSGLRLRLAVIPLDESLNSVHHFGAVYTVSVSAGAVTGFTQISQGQGYTGTPNSRLWGEGTGATYTLTMTDDKVSAVNLTNGNGGSGYVSGFTFLSIDPPLERFGHGTVKEMPVRLQGGLPSTIFGGSTAILNGFTASRICVFGPQTKFAELIVYPQSESPFAPEDLLGILDGFEIHSMDGTPLLVSNRFNAFHDKEPWVLEKPDETWVTNGGTWPPGQFVRYAGTDDTINRPEGFVHLGAGVFRQEPLTHISATPPSDTDLIWFPIE